MIFERLKTRLKSGRRRMQLGACLACIAVGCAAGSLVCWKHKHAVIAPPAPRVAPPSFVGPIGPVYPDPPGILIHHSDTPAKLHGVTFNAAALDRIAQERGFSITFEGKTYHISYHYVILPDGTIETGRP